MYAYIEGDIKEVCSRLKKQNKKEVIEHKSGQHLLFEPPIKLGNLAKEYARLAELTDDTIESVHQKETEFAKLVSSTPYLYSRLLADMWCAVFVWKKDESDIGQLCPTEYHFRRTESNPHSTNIHVRDEVKRLADQYQFFHWHLAFPDVFHLPGKGETPENEQNGWSGGFDVVLGNPPWERIQVEEKQFFSSSHPVIAAARSKDRQKLIDALKTEAPFLFLSWQEANRLGHGQSHLVKTSRMYLNSGKGNVNTFALFGELASNRINRSGRVGFILPSGVITEASNEDLFRSWLERRKIVSGLDFENSTGMFDDVHRSFRFCLLTLCGENVGPQRPSFCFFLTTVEESRDVQKLILLGKDELQLLNPSSLTCPPIRSRKDAEILLNAHRRFGIFIGEKPTKLNPWNADSRQMLNSSHDSGSFVEIAPEVVTNMDLQGLIYQDSRTLMRLYDGKMIDQFDHRFSSTGHNLATLFRTTSSERTADDDHVSPEFLVTPQYWVALSKVSPLVPEQCMNRGWWLAFRAVTASTNWRTVVASVLPLCGQVHSLPALYCPLSASENVALLACLNSLALDYCARLKLSGTHLSHFVFKQLPVPPPTIFGQKCLWFGDQTLIHWLLPLVLELTYTAWDLEPFARDCGYTGPPFRWDEKRRFLLRAEIDAAFFHLYLPADANGDWLPARKANGCPHDESSEDLTRLKESFPTPRDTVSYIMDTFPIVRRKDEAAHNGDYRTKRVILEIYDAMQESIRTGKPYQTRLDPPPGPPTDSDGKFIPVAEWDESNWPSHIHPPRSGKARTGL